MYPTPGRWDGPAQSEGTTDVDTKDGAAKTTVFILGGGKRTLGTTRVELNRVTGGAAEEVFAVSPLFRKTKQGHYAAFGPTRAGRLVVVVFEMKGKGVARVITGWDMDNAEGRYYQLQRRR